MVLGTWPALLMHWEANRKGDGLEVEICEATDGDAEELRQYAEALFSEKLPGVFRRAAPTLEQELEFIRSRTEPANSTLLVARQDGAIVGLLDFAGGTLAEEAHAGTFGLSVKRGHRGKGVGTRLVEALLAWAPAHGVWRIQAWAWVNNPQAVALYERLGFLREGLCQGAVVLDGGPIDVVLLARLLTDRCVGSSRPV